MMHEDERAIRQLVATWMDATRRGDTETVRSLMTDDIIFMVPNQKPFGKEAFADPPAGTPMPKIEGDAEILELQLMGDWAYIRNYIDVRFTLPDGNSMRHAGHTLSILRKSADGKWRLYRDANLVAPCE